MYYLVQPYCTSRFYHLDFWRWLWTASIKIPRTYEDIGSHRVRVLFVFLPLALLVFGYVSSLLFWQMRPLKKEVRRFGRTLGIHGANTVIMNIPWRRFLRSSFPFPSLSSLPTTRVLKNIVSPFFKFSLYWLCSYSSFVLLPLFLGKVCWDPSVCPYVYVWVCFPSPTLQLTLL